MYKDRLIYFAPLEGITGYVYRQVYQKYFAGVDTYFSPFIATNQFCVLKGKERRDILPENNIGIHLVPQLLSNQASDFIETAKQIKELGYSTVNLNLGCPSSTVVAKKKGAGFLADTERLHQFLEEIFTYAATDISIKTRIGMKDPEEFSLLLSIYNEYPIKELIVHPRTQADYYNNQPDFLTFSEAVKNSKNPVVYNGNLCTKEDLETVIARFPSVGALMIGRGFLKNPGFLLGQNEELKSFHDELLAAYQQVLSGEKPVLFKMKELWLYQGNSFLNSSDYLKKIKKAEHLLEYQKVVEDLFSSCQIIG